MDSKQVSPSSGSSSPPPIPNSIPLDSEIDSVVDSNGLVSDVKDGDNNVGSVHSSNSDDGGFVSGEEDFETAPERPLVALPVDEILVKGSQEDDDIDIGGFVVGSPDFATPRAQIATPRAETGKRKVEIPDVVIPDDVVGTNPSEEVEGDGVLMGEEIGVLDTFGSSPAVENGDVDKVMVDEVDSKPVEVEGYVEKPKTYAEVVVENSNSDEPIEVEGHVEMPKTYAEAVAENSNSDGLVGESKLEAPIEDLGGSKEDLAVEKLEVVGDAISGVSVQEEVGAEDVKLNGEHLIDANSLTAVDTNGGGEAVIESTKPAGDSVVEESTVLSGGANQINSETTESVDSNLVESGVKLTAEGDAVVEEINVKLSEPGVAVVGETEEEDNQLNTEIEPVEANLVDSVVKLTTEGDSIVEEIDVKLSEPGVAVVGETKENSDSEVKAVEFSVNGSLKLDNSFEPSTSIDVETAEPKLVGLTTADSVADNDENFDIGVVGTDNVMGTNSNDVEEGANINEMKKEKTLDSEIEPEADSDAKKDVGEEKISANAEQFQFGKQSVGADEDGKQALDSMLVDTVQEENVLERSTDFVTADATEPLQRDLMPEEVEAEDEVENHTDEEDGIEGSMSDDETDGMVFGSSEAAKQFIEELEQGSAANSQLLGESSRDNSERIDGQIVTDSDEEDTDEGDGKELFDSAALAALLKAATGADSDGGNITITSQDGSRLFSVERPAGLGSSLRSLKPGSRPIRPNLFTNSSLTTGGEAENNLSEEDKKKLEKLQQLRVKFLRLVHRLGLAPEDSIAAQVLYRLAVVAGRQTSQQFNLDAAKRTAMQLEAEGKDDDLDFSLNILIIGKSGVGKSATINSIFGEEKAVIDAFQPATSSVKEIRGMVDGVKIRAVDTPGLKSSAMEQAYNRRVLSSAKNITKKNPPDVVLYVDRLDAQTRDLNDLPLLRTITGSLGQSIWRSAIVTLTHGASAPPDGPSGSPLSYEGFVTQRSHVVQHSIGQAVGDLRMMNPVSMNPVSLVENHPLCRKNRDGQKVLPNGQSWRQQLMMLCYSLKILAEANSFMKPQDPFDHRKLFGIRMRSPPLPYMLSSMLQTRAHPKLSPDQGGENGDSDVDLADLSDSDQEDDEDEYDQLPPFKPLRKSQMAKLSKEQRKAYFEEYDYRVKLLRKKQWREELKRLKEIKKRGKDASIDYGYLEEDADQENSPAPVAVPLPDMVLPPSFDGDNPAYRFRFLEPTSQFLARPVLDTHGWDHDCGYDGVNLEHSLAIASQFPAAVAVQLTKDKKEFSIHLDSSVSAKHGENGSTMAGFDIQTIGKQLAYIVRGETKFKNLKKNKTAAGLSVTFLGENVATGLKIEDQIALGKQWGLMGSAGTIRSQGDAAYGANFELQHRELDYPIGQVQSTYSMSLIKWRGDWALGLNTMAQFSVGRTSKVAVRAGINNKLSGQITVRTSSSEHLSFALAGIIPIAINIYNKIWPAVGENYSIY